MELKDVILSTLAELENEEESFEPPKKIERVEPKKVEVKVENLEDEKIEIKYEKPEIKPNRVKKKTNIDDELLFLNSVKDRLLVLFEGFQAPNNTNIEAKIDMTLNFLEYTLATIDSRIEKIEKGDQI